MGDGGQGGGKNPKSAKIQISMIEFKFSGYAKPNELSSLWIKNLPPKKNLIIGKKRVGGVKLWKSVKNQQSLIEVKLSG